MRDWLRHLWTRLVALGRTSYRSPFDQIDKELDLKWQQFQAELRAQRDQRR